MKGGAFSASRERDANTGALRDFVYLGGKVMDPKDLTRAQAIDCVRRLLGEQSASRAAYRRALDNTGAQTAATKRTVLLMGMVAGIGLVLGIAGLLAFWWR